VGRQKKNMPAENDNSGEEKGLAAPAPIGATNAPASAAGAILIADDDRIDALHAKKTVEKLRLPVLVHEVFSGRAALAYLEGQGRYEDRGAYPYPALLLLDLNMPDMDGFEVLKWLEGRPEHRRLPVIVLSGVRELAVVSRAYRLGARSFFIKPLALDDLRAAFQALKIFPDFDTSHGGGKQVNGSH
jgi:CheY-like chemotaxis protein